MGFHRKNPKVWTNRSNETEIENPLPNSDPRKTGSPLSTLSPSCVPLHSDLNKKNLVRFKFSPRKKFLTFSNPNQTTETHLFVLFCFFLFCCKCRRLHPFYPFCRKIFWFGCTGFWIRRVVKSGVSSAKSSSESTR